MKLSFPFKELPGTSQDYLRPAIPVTVEGISHAPQLCLLDAGALHNRFATWVADAAGIDLSGCEEQRLAVGGFGAFGPYYSLTLDLESLAHAHRSGGAVVYKALIKEVLAR